ncbi:MAG: cyclic nucleotide-binding domain-containing protein [Betaproteobacteria bacterium]|jgi:CRP-like cAMP-binding protein|uniref:Cyclic nucleotide-binding protein n=1 Tax=Thiomonas delicata TaxID=364030 RepID=A0A238D4V7_THIDL|nr:MULTISPECIES: cyclic nucleotide-binding domain-containing protein [Thiomonas]MDE2130698.1 cyclic nucleotide-binding domain-containing protein [Betaproteobacteria bacterium]OZB45639.1 MAG: cyclic nucleotide-binding protein [Thiomonas sp. 15-66-11]OZB54350.1 MAG: cyclic nucleotide-binding protein [Thiomonas sp. 14-66-4]OZB62281.1 MAG: cyclic nucleotide-binding protein [Thiomonas sp. 13-66-29]SBP88249.1 Cyclic nucleotide-binding protein [Thiomonas delicata]
MHPNRLELLQRMPIFGGIREEALAVLLQRARVAVVPTADYFFRENDPAQSMFVLEAGSVRVIKSWQGRDVELRRLAPGDCFGEMALIDLYPRSASIRAAEDCRALEFGPEDLMHLFEHDMEQFALIQMNLARELSRRLRDTDAKLFRVKMGEAPERPQG